MSVYYPTDCDELVPAHVCDPCETLENGRVRSVAFVKNTVTFTDITNPVEWAAQFAAGNVIIIPAVKGSFDGGAEVEGTGYGNQATRLTGYNFQAQYQDPNYKSNCNFYNAIKNAKNYYFVYRTSSQIHMSDAVVQVIPKNPVTDDLTSEVVWDVIVKWQASDLPCPNDIPAGIFELCTYVT